MSLFAYTIKTACKNCGFKNELNIKKGITIKEFAESQKGSCKNCGCKIAITEFQTPWLK